MRLRRAFNLTVLETYGLSECPMGASNLADMRKPGSMGKPSRHPNPDYYTRVRLVDDADRDVSAGQVGELLLQSPALMVGYYQDAERTAEAMRGGWFHTGDYAYQDADGFYFLWTVKRMSFGAGAKIFLPSRSSACSMIIRRWRKAP